MTTRAVRSSSSGPLPLNSPAARQIIKYELLDSAPFTGLKNIIKQRKRVADFTGLEEFDNSDFFAPMASGSSEFEAVVVVPCSMKTLAAIASGFADTLINRTCDVALKEKRRCIIVPRETPLNLIHLKNMYQAAQAGVYVHGLAADMAVRKTGQVSLLASDIIEKLPQAIRRFSGPGKK